MNVRTPLAPPGDELLPLRPALVLSEEELLVLTDGDRGVVPARIELPETPEAADLVREVATRTLMARGFITPTGPDRPADDHGRQQIEWEAAEPLGLTLSVRALAPVVMALSRVLGPLETEQRPGEGPPAPTSAVRYLHLHPEVAVIEDVTPAGMHGLLTAFPDRFHEAIADFILPSDVAPGAGPVRTLPGGLDPDRTHGEPESGLLGGLGNPRVIVEAGILRPRPEPGTPPDPDWSMLVLGPEGTFCSQDSRTYHPVDPHEAIDDLLRRALWWRAPDVAVDGVA